MRKHAHLIAILTMIVMVLALAGCNSAPAKTADKAPAAPAENKAPAEKPKEEPKKPSYPEKDIEVTIPFSAGGGSDIFARNIEKVIKDNKLIDVNMILVNKPGASGSIGYSYVAKAVGDPYKLATVSSSFYTAPILGKSPVSSKDFTPIAGLAMDTLGLVVKADSKYNSIKEIIADAKAAPDTLTVGGTSGTSDDAVMYYALGDRAGVKMKYVPFNSGGEVMTALLGGHVDMVWVNPGEGLTQLEAGKAKMLAVASKERLSGLPDTKTLIEEGINLSLAQFRGVVGPKDMPEDAVKYLEGVLKKMSEQKGWKEDYLKTNMVEGRFLGAAEFDTAIKDTMKMYEEFLNKIPK